MKRQNRKEGNGEMILLHILPMHRCRCRGCRIAPFQSQSAVMGMGTKHLFSYGIAAHIAFPEVIDRVQKSAKIIPHGMISLVTKPKGDHPRWISCTQLK